MKIFEVEVKMYRLNEWNKSNNEEREREREREREKYIKTNR